MRICIVTREYSSVTPYSGGIGTTFAVLCPEFVKQGHDVHVLAVTDSGPHEMERGGVRFHLLRNPVPHWRFHALEETIWMVRAERALRRLGRFDVIFAPEWGGDLALYVRHKRSGPVVIQLTSSLQQLLMVSPGLKLKPGWWLRYKIQQVYEHYQTRHADGILASTQSILDWARELWRIDHVPAVVVPNVLQVDRVRQLATHCDLPDGWPQNGPVVAFSGRLESRKGPHVLAEAMQSVWTRFPQANLVIMGRDSAWGDGQMSEHLRQLAGSHVDQVHILGNQPPERLFAALGRADVVALPSLWENFASAALEAMAAGAAVVLTTGGGFQEFVRADQDGLLVPPADAPALAAAITRLLEDRGLRDRLGASAAEKVMEYDAPVVSHRYVDFFQDVSAASR